MQPALNEHAGEEILERYSMGGLSGEQLEAFEAHLLVCPTCQERLEETDAYIRATRTALAKLRREDAARVWNPTFFIPKPAWVGALAAVLLLLVWSSGWWESGHSPPVAVALHAARGAAEAPVSRAPKGLPLLLQIDVAELPGLADWEVEVVNADGSRVWFSAASAEGARMSLELPRPLREGKYWVRLHSAGPPKQLLREFALQVE